MSLAYYFLVSVTGYVVKIKLFKGLLGYVVCVFYLVSPTYKFLFSVGLPTLHLFHIKN